MRRLVILILCLLFALPAAGQTIKVQDIEPEETIKIMSDDQTVICAVVAKGAAEEEVAEDEDEAGEEAAAESAEPAAEKSE